MAQEYCHWSLVSLKASTMISVLTPSQCSRRISRPLHLLKQRSGGWHCLLKIQIQTLDCPSTPKGLSHLRKWLVSKVFDSLDAVSCGSTGSNLLGVKPSGSCPHQMPCTTWSMSLLWDVIEEAIEIPQKYLWLSVQTRTLRGWWRWNPVQTVFIYLHRAEKM